MATSVAMTTLLRFWGLKVWVFHSLNPFTDFNQTFRVCLTQEDLEVIRFWVVSGNNCCQCNIFKNFGS